MGEGVTPKSLGYYFPAEFAKHEAIWLTWPHKEESWPGKIASIYPSYTEFVLMLWMKKCATRQIKCCN
jgi:agmatine deiminase